MDQMDLISWVGIKSSLVVFHEVVADVKESCAVESRSKRAILRITRDQAGKPVISDAHRRDYSTLATVFETSLAKDCELSHRSYRSNISIRRRENFCLVQENDFNSLNYTLMHS